MKALVFGQTGQLAVELARLDQPGVTLSFLSRGKVDLTDALACVAAVEAAEVDAVINAAAYTAVDKAEADEGTATAVNAVAPAAMALTCAQRGLPLVHVSTDYVFDGSGDRPWTIDDPVAPLGAYGRSKLAGERGIAAAGGRSAILRTSWVFSAHGANFVKAMLRLGRERDRLRIVADQTGGPTPAADLAVACVAVARGLLNGGPSGIFHYSGAPDVTWAGFARTIFRHAGLDVAVDEIASADYPTPARRPMNSRLDCGRIRDDYGLERPDWEVGLVRVLDELLAGDKR